MALETAKRRLPIAAWDWVGVGKWGPAGCLADRAVGGGLASGVKQHWPGAAGKGVELMAAGNGGGSAPRHRPGAAGDGLDLMAAGNGGGGLVGGVKPYWPAGVGEGPDLLTVGGGLDLMAAGDGGDGGLADGVKQHWPGGAGERLELLAVGNGGGGVLAEDVKPHWPAGVGEGPELLTVGGGLELMSTGDGGGGGGGLAGGVKPYWLGAAGKGLELLAAGGGGLAEDVKPHWPAGVGEGPDLLMVGGGLELLAAGDGGLAGGVKPYWPGAAGECLELMAAGGGGLADGVKSYWPGAVGEGPDLLTVGEGLELMAAGDGGGGLADGVKSYWPGAVGEGPDLLTVGEGLELLAAGDGGDGGGDGGGVQWHRAAMVGECLEVLGVKPGGVYLDGTVGEGGHARALLDGSAPDGVVIGIDRDPRSVAAARRRLGGYGSRAALVHGTYADMGRIAAARGIEAVDGILLDLGFSSRQVDMAGYGFSFQRDEPLDMRYDWAGATAAQLVNSAGERELADLIYRYGEERRSRAIARAIVNSRPIATTGQLAQAVMRAVGGRRGGRHPATRTFQALRIAVNGELEQLSGGLAAAIELLGPGGRLAVISYHSLEDRLVKGWVQRESALCVCPPRLPVCVCERRPTVRVVRRRAARPGAAETAANPRVRSARLRAVERV